MSSFLRQPTLVIEQMLKKMVSECVCNVSVQIYGLRKNMGPKILIQFVAHNMSCTLHMHYVDSHWIFQRLIPIILTVHVC